MSELKKLLASTLQRAQSSIIRDLLKYSKTPGMLSLAGGIPAPDLFDIQGIEAALEQAKKLGVDCYQYSVTDGEPDLRKGIVDLLSQRGIDAQSEHIVVTNGSQQALDLITRSLFDEGDIAVVERPTYLAAIQVLNLCNVNIVDVEGDENGINPDILEQVLQKQKIKGIYIVPNFANPTGSTLTLERRKRLIELARDYKFIIIEDDPYGEIRFTQCSEPSLYQLSKEIEGAYGYVVYLSSFSKILVPGLRVGFLVAHPEIRNNVVIAKQSFDLHCPVLSQKLVSNYLTNGRMEKRIALLRSEYKKRCDVLIKALEKHVGEDLEFHAPDGGMFLWANLKHGLSSKELLPKAIEENIVFVPGSAFYVREPEDQAMRLSFATITEEQADEAARRLAQAIARLKQEKGIK